MVYVTLKFISTKDLVDFQMTTGILQFEIDEINYVLFAMMSDAELELALNGFGAKSLDLSVSD